MQCCSNSCFTFETFLLRLSVKSAIDISWSWYFSRGVLKKHGVLKVFSEKLKIFLCCLSAWEIWYEKNTRPLNKIKTGVIYWGDKLVSLCLIWPVKHDTKCWLCQAASVKNLLHNGYNRVFPGSKKKKKAKTRVPKRNDLLKKIWNWNLPAQPRHWEISTITAMGYSPRLINALHLVRRKTDLSDLLSAFVTWLVTFVTSY